MMSSQENEDVLFVNNVLADLEGENTLNNSGFYTYLLKALKVIQDGGKIRQFCDLLSQTVETHLNNVKEKIDHPIETQSSQQLVGSDRKKFLKDVKQQAYSRIKFLGNSVLQFFHDVIDGTHSLNSSYFLWKSMASLEQSNHIETIVQVLKDENKLAEISIDQIYLEVVSNTRIGLQAKKEQIFPLIEKTIKGEKEVEPLPNISKPQQYFIDQLIIWGIQDMETTSEIVSQSDEVRVSSRTRVPICKFTQPPTKLKETTKSSTKSSKRKSRNPLNVTVDVDVEGAEEEDNGDDDNADNEKDGSRTQVLKKLRSSADCLVDSRRNHSMALSDPVASTKQPSFSSEQEEKKEGPESLGNDDQAGPLSDPKQPSSSEQGSEIEEEQERELMVMDKLSADLFKDLCENIRVTISTQVLSTDQIFYFGNCILSALESKYKDTFPSTEENFVDKLFATFSNDRSKPAAISSSSSTALTGQAPLSSLRTNPEVAAISSSSSTALTGQAPLSSLRTNPEVAAISSSSSTALTGQAPLSSLQTFLESLGIISKKWTAEKEFKIKFTTLISCINDVGQTISKSCIRYQTLVSVLSGFLHHRSKLHPQTNSILKLFENLKKQYTNGDISLSAVDRTQMEEFQYVLGSISSAEFINRDSFAQKVSERLVTTLQQSDTSRCEDYLSRCLFLVKLTKPSDTTISAISSIDLPLSFPVDLEDGKVVLQAVAAIYGDGEKAILVQSICRTSYHCGGYYTVKILDGVTEMGELLDPLKVSKTPVFPLVRKDGREKYFLQELVFIETFSQCYSNAKLLLDEEDICRGTESISLKPAVLRTFLAKADYTELDVLDSVIGLLRQKLNQKNQSASNILLPTCFYELVLGNKSKIQSLSDLEDCAEDLRLSSYPWDVESSVVHLVLSYPISHWQYCAIVFKKKMVYFYDSLVSYTDDGDCGKRWLGIQKLLRFVYEHLGQEFNPDEWNKTSPPTPQQTEKTKVHCGIYFVVFLLRGVSEGLSDNGANWDNIDWKKPNGSCLTTFTPELVQALKRLIVGAILGESDIFDIFYLFVPESKRSEVQNQSWSEVFGDFEFKRLPLSRLCVEVISFKILDM
jgi:hypothetical protein